MVRVLVVAQAGNPSYSGGRDQGFKASLGNKSKTLSQKYPIPNTKKGWLSGSGGRTPA
jgi:hypothetical protein